VLRVATIVALLFCPSVLAADIHVATSGNDANPGTRAAPLLTLRAAMARLHEGDHLLLRRGDTWREPLGVLRTSGVTITAYGEGRRPEIDAGDRNGLDVSGGAVTDVSLVGVAIVGETRSDVTNPAGIRWLGGGNLLIQDCLIEGFATNVIVMGCHDVVIRGNVIRNAHPVADAEGHAPHSQGIFASRTIGLTIEDNVIDGNGWHPTKKGAEPTWFNHNIYVSEGSARVTIRNNILSRTAGFGIKCCVAATIEDNLFYRCPLGFSVSYRRHPVGDYQDALVRNNVVLCSNDIEARSRPPIIRGNGFNAAHLKKLTVVGNIFGPPDTRGDVSTGFALTGGTSSPKTDGLACLSNVTVRENIVYGYDVCLSLTGDSFGPVLIADNVFNGRTDLEGRTPRNLVSIRIPEEARRSFVFRGNTYHHAAGYYASLGPGSRLSFQALTALTGETDAVERRETYPDPYITPHGAVGLGSFDELLAAAETGQLNAAQINAAVRERGFGIRPASH